MPGNQLSYAVELVLILAGRLQVDLPLLAEEMVGMAGFGEDEPAGLLSNGEAIVGDFAEVPQLVGHADRLVGLSDDILVVENIVQ